jgi:hypothetical protein
MARYSSTDQLSASSVSCDQLTFIALKKEEKLRELESELSYLQQLFGTPNYESESISKELTSYESE